VRGDLAEVWWRQHALLVCPERIVPGVRRAGQYYYTMRRQLAKAGRDAKKTSSRTTTQRQPHRVAAKHPRRRSNRENETFSSVDKLSLFLLQSWSLPFSRCTLRLCWKTLDYCCTASTAVRSPLLRRWGHQLESRRKLMIVFDTNPPPIFGDLSPSRTNQTTGAQTRSQ